VTATLDGSTPGVISNAFSVTVNGLTATQLGITPGDLSGTPGRAPVFTSSREGLTVTASGLLAEKPSLPDTPQRFTWVCAADFHTSPGPSPSLVAFAGVTGLNPVWVALTASINGLSAYAWTLLVLDKHGGLPVTG